MLDKWSAKQWSNVGPKKVSFPESASGEDESDYNYCFQAFFSVNSALCIRSQPSYLLVVPVYDTVSADRIVFKQSQVVCVLVTPLCAYIWLVMLMIIIYFSIC